MLYEVHWMIRLVR